MIVDQRREVLERLAAGELTPDEAEHHLAALDETGPPTRPLETGYDDTRPLETHAGTPASAGTQAPASPASASVGPGTDQEHGIGAGVLSRGVVKARLSGSGLIEVAADDDAQDTRIDGPHSCSIKQMGDRTKVSGDFGDDTVLVYPSAAHLDVEANSPNALVRGLRSTLRARFNVGKARVEGVLTRGDSEIEANVGLLDLVFQSGSDVRVSVRCAARIDAGDGLRKIGRGEWVVGSGAGHVDITGSPGVISLSVE
jgi:hypothetical protein